MAYWRDTWKFTNSTEYEIKFAGKYGARGEKRAKRKKATPEQIKKQNQRNREKRIRRIIKANFLPSDIWATLKYPKGCRKPVGEVKKDIRKFLTDLRKEYKKQGEQLKFIYRLEVGARGGIHIHILLNRARGKPETDMLMQKLWKHGRVNYESIYEQGGYDALAAYIVKEPDEDIAGQMTLFDEKDKREWIKYSSSRNLIRPEPEREEFKRRTVRDLVKNGPTPSPGYYIDPNSITCGTNPFTGMSYYHYTEVRIKEVTGRSSPPDGGNICRQ